MTQLNVVDNTVNLEKLIEIDASTVFPDVFSPGESKVRQRFSRHPDCIVSNPNYVPDESVLRRVLAWWHAPQRQALGLHGETGTGKTELLLYIADKLNEPVYIVKTHAALMPEELEGSKELENENGSVITRNRLGLAAKAYQHGGLLILDEVDKANEALQSSLHPLVEGKPWPIEQFGMIVNKHIMCRISATANTTGEGGSERYHTSQKMDSALRSRFGWLELGYPDPATEIDIMTRNFPKLPRNLLHEMVGLGTAIREQVYAPGADMQAVFSTRTLVNWGHYLMVFGLKARAVESLDFAFMGSVDPESKDKVNDTIQRLFDKKLDQSLHALLATYQVKK